MMNSEQMKSACTGGLYSFRQVGMGAKLGLNFTKSHMVSIKPLCSYATNIVGIPLKTSDYL